MPRGFACSTAWPMCLLAAMQLSCGGQSTPVAPSASSAAITIQSIAVTLTTVGDQYQGAAVAAFSDGLSRDVTEAANWVSSNTAVAAVSSTGRVTILTNGDADIRATYLDTVGSVRLAVINRQPIPPTQPNPPAPSPAPEPVLAPLPAPVYPLTGALRDGLDQRLLEAADVSASGKTVRFLSPLGTSYVMDLPAGTHTVTVTSVGYETASRVVTLTENTVLDFTLTPTAGTLRINSLFHIDSFNSNQRRVPCEGRVEILEGPDAGRFAVIPSGGQGVITNVQPGRFRMRASATNYESDETIKRFRANGANDYINFQLCPVGSGPVCIRELPPCS